MHSFEVKELCAPLLKEATRQHHEKAEAVMMPLIHRANTPEGYTFLLQRLYGFYKPMENIIAPQAGTLGLPFDFRKSHLLLRDLHLLGRGPAPELCTNLPKIADACGALGALYVLEGAALGGRVIRKMLSAGNHLPENAFSFFDGRGKETGPHWIRFTQFLNSRATTPFQIQQVGAAANDTFERHANWMQTL